MSAPKEEFEENFGASPCLNATKLNTLFLEVKWTCPLLSWWVFDKPRHSCRFLNGLHSLTWPHLHRLHYFIIFSLFSHYVYYIYYFYYIYYIIRIYRYVALEWWHTVGSAQFIAISNVERCAYACANQIGIQAIVVCHCHCELHSCHCHCELRSCHYHCELCSCHCHCELCSCHCHCELCSCHCHCELHSQLKWSESYRKCSLTTLDLHELHTCLLAVWSGFQFFTWIFGGYWCDVLNPFWKLAAADMWTCLKTIHTSELPPADQRQLLRLFLKPTSNELRYVWHHNSNFQSVLPTTHTSTHTGWLTAC